MLAIRTNLLTAPSLPCPTVLLIPPLNLPIYLESEREERKRKGISCALNNLPLNKLFSGRFSSGGFVF